MKRKAAISEELKDQYEKQLRRIKRFVRQATKRGYDFPDTAIPKRPKTITEASVRKAASLTPDVLYKKATYTKNTGEVITGLEGRKHERQQAAIKAAETRRASKPSSLSYGNTVKQSLTPKTKSKSKSKRPSKPNPRQLPKTKKAKKTPAPSSNTGKGKGKKKDKKTPQDRYYESGDKKKGSRKEPIDRTDVVLENVLATLEEMIRAWQPLPNWTPSLVIIKTKDKNLAKAILNSAIVQIGRVLVASNCEKHAEEIIPLLEEILYGSGSKEGNFKDGRTQVNADIIAFQSMLLDRPTTPEENWELVDVMESFVDEEADEDTEQYYAGYTTTLHTDTDSEYDTDLTDNPYSFS